MLTAVDGFVLAENKHDSTKLDDFVLPLLTTAQSTLLEQHSYLGYVTKFVPHTIVADTAL